MPHVRSAGARARSTGARARSTGTRRRLPPHTYFLVSAVFHYLGPALAVLLFARVAPLGVALRADPPRPPAG